MTSEDQIHYSVMKAEVLENLDLKTGEIVVDATVNRAGHSAEFAKLIGANGKLIINDLDKNALEYSVEKLERLDNAPKIYAVHGNFRDLAEEIKKLADLKNSQKVDAVFADLGFSSQEIEISGRGFSFQKDEPLLMTYQSEITPETFTAKDLLQNLDAVSLAKIFQIYADEKNAFKIANKIVETRHELSKHGKKIETTFQLVEIIESVSKRHGKTHPATKVFQAIRIAVNDEYESLKKFILEMSEILNSGGKLAILSFHSGEDRIVKNLFKELEKKDFLKSKKFKPSRKEILENKRSRSVLLRVIQKK